MRGESEPRGEEPKVSVSKTYLGEINKKQAPKERRRSMRDVVEEEGEKTDKFAKLAEYDAKNSEVIGREEMSERSELRSRIEKITGKAKGKMDKERIMSVLDQVYEILAEFNKGKKKNSEQQTVLFVKSPDSITFNLGEAKFFIYGEAGNKDGESCRIHGVWFDNDLARSIFLGKGEKAA